MQDLQATNEELEVESRTSTVLNVQRLDEMQAKLDDAEEEHQHKQR
jgi:hypothetical protein